jgi:hypothetical protein
MGGLSAYAIEYIDPPNLARCKYVVLRNGAENEKFPCGASTEGPNMVYIDRGKLL